MSEPTIKTGFNKMSVFDSNLLPVPFDAMNITSRGGVQNKPLVIDFYQNGLQGTKVMTMTLTHDASGDVTTVETKVDKNIKQN